jgi:hypothetical protein
MSTVGYTLPVLILRSDPEDRVSKDGGKRRCLWSSFETRPLGAPQDEVRWLRTHLRMRAVR